MWELDCEEDWAPKNWCFWTVALEKTLESPLDCKEILMRTVDSLEKTDAGRDWGQEEKGTTENEMAGWHHRLDWCESEWTPGDGDGQGGLACCDSWGLKESDMTEWLNWTELTDVTRTKIKHYAFKKHFMTTTQLFTTLLLSIMDGLKIAVCYNLCIKNKLFLMMQCHIANRPHQMALGLCVEIKRCVVLGWKAMVNLDSILESRTITLWQRSI